MRVRCYCFLQAGDGFDQSVFLVDLKPIKTAYSAAAGTALVTFEDAVVPAKYMMGKENEGLKVRLSCCLIVIAIIR